MDSLVLEGSSAVFSEVISDIVTPLVVVGLEAKLNEVNTLLLEDVGVLGAAVAAAAGDAGFVPNIELEDENAAPKLIVSADDDVGALPNKELDPNIDEPVDGIAGAAEETTVAVGLPKIELWLATVAGALGAVKAMVTRPGILAGAEVAAGFTSSAGLSAAKVAAGLVTGDAV